MFVRTFHFLFCLLAFHPLSAMGQGPKATIEQAERLFAEKLYGDALPLYSLLLIPHLESEAELQDHLTLRLATCYLEEGYPQAALDILTPLPCSNKCLYLMGLAHRYKQETFQAFQLLQQCSPVNESQYFKNYIHLEKGYHLFQLEDFKNAQSAFETVVWQENNPLSFYLARLNLARIHLKTNNLNKAQKALILPHPIPQEHPLNLEKLYLEGLLLLANHQDDQAMACFEQLLPKSTAKYDCSIPILHGLVISYLRQALMLNLPLNDLKALLNKAEGTLQKLLDDAPTESSYLLMSDFYLIKAKRLDDLQAYSQAQKLLKQDLFNTPEGKRQVLLKLAEGTPSYQERDRLYQRLTTEPHQPAAFYAHVWFLKGLNDFEDSLHLSQAAQAFAQAVHLYENANSIEEALALKHLVLAYALQKEPHQICQAWEVLKTLLNRPPLLASIPYPQELYCLAGWLALQLNDKAILREAKVFLQHSQTYPLTNKWRTLELKLEGLVSLQLEEWKQAEALFSRLKEEYHSTSYGEACFWLAHCAEKQNQSALKKDYLQQVYAQDFQSPYAPVAYFHFYSYSEYMRGERKAIKHLQAMPNLFPNHPLIITAYYLIGMDHKKDHLTEAGQVLRRKDWTAAIDAFQLAEATFDALFTQKLISLDDMTYFTQVHYRAKLERAQANLSIAQHSIGGKRQIYLEYAEGVFKELIQDLSTRKILDDKIFYPKILSEAEFKLAQTYTEREKWKDAENILDQSLSRFQQNGVHQGYGSMRVWNEKGKLAQKRADFVSALHCFLEAEKATTSEHLGLSPDEKLELWIQQSLCHKEMHQYEEAMRLLSRVINDDVISAVRIKAMYLRAEIYELQNRPELALKQLEATASKGGEWSQKAKEKLENYVY